MESIMNRGMSRRAFVGKGTLFLVGATAVPVLASGCGIEDIATFAPIGADAFAEILFLLGDPGTSLIVLAIKAAFQDIPADIAAYKAANPPPVGTFAKIDQVLSELLGNFQQFVASASINNPIVSLVAMLAGVILSTVAGFLQKYFPQSASLPNTKDAMKKKFSMGNSVAINFTPRVISIYEFKQEWNRTARAGGRPDAQLHIGIFEHITRR